MGTNSRSSMTMSYRNNPTPSLPLVATLNCIEDCGLEQDFLSGVATVEHVSLARLADGKIESAAAVVLHSLAYLPRAAQRRLRPYQLILCLGSADPGCDSAFASDLGLQLVHVDASRAEEIADSIMALILRLLRRTYLLSRHMLSAFGWLGSLQPLCRGMRRCRGLVLGIVGRSASTRSLATRSLTFKMSVLYFDVPEFQILSEGYLKHIKPGCSFKPCAYVNHYLQGAFVASADAVLASLSSEELPEAQKPSTAHNSKGVAANIQLQAKTFSLAVSRFFWPTSQRKLVEVPRERYSWCCTCKGTVSRKSVHVELFCLICCLKCHENYGWPYCQEWRGEYF